MSDVLPASPLAPGDRIEVGTTYEFKVNGQATWVKVGVNTAVQEGESADAARLRAGKYVARSLITECERVAEKIMEADQAQGK